MALAEPALRQFGIQKLRNVRFRGGNLLGTAIGAAIGIGFGIASNYEFGLPRPGIVQPDRTKRTPFVNGKTSYVNKDAYSQYQTYGTKNKRKFGKRRFTKRCTNRCCCYRCN